MIVLLLVMDLPFVTARHGHVHPCRACEEPARPTQAGRLCEMGAGGGHAGAGRDWTRLIVIIIIIIIIIVIIYNMTRDEACGGETGGISGAG